MRTTKFIKLFLGLSIVLLSTSTSYSQVKGRPFIMMSDYHTQLMHALIEQKAQNIFKEDEMDFERFHSILYAQLVYRDIQFKKLYPFDEEHVTKYEFDNLTDMKKVLRKVVNDKKFIWVIVKQFRDGLYFIYTYDFQFIY